MDKHDSLFQGFGERLQNMGVFSPLFDMQHKTRLKEYPVFSLGIATLLFLIENMLTENRGTSNEELTVFIQDLLNERYNQTLSWNEAEHIREVLVNDFLRNQGNPHEFTYYNFDTKVYEVHRFDLIEYHHFDMEKVQQKKIFLQLSPQGVELLFKTKEVFNEIQISITQLYFKQQIQKGLFDGALQSVNELNLQIQNERTKMIELQSKILRDAIEVSKQQEVEKQLERFDKQLIQERETFQDLKQLVHQILDDYYSGQLSEKEEKGLDMIHEIERRLKRVIAHHESLFTEKQTLQRVMSESIEAILINAFQVKLNFEKEVVEEVLRTNPSLLAITQIVNPLFSFKKHAVFHPGRLFEEQKRIRIKEEKQEEVSVIDERAIEQQEQEEAARQQAKEKQQQFILSRFLAPLVTHETYTAQFVLDELKQQDPDVYEELTKDMALYSYLIELHQEEQPRFEKIDEQDLIHVTSLARQLTALGAEYPELFDIEFFSVQPNGKTIVLESGYVLSDFTIQRGNVYAMGTK